MLKKFIEYVEKISNLTIKQLFKIFLFGVVCVIIGYGITIATDKEYAPKLTDQILSHDEQEIEGMKLRNKITPLVQKKLLEMTIKLGCDRAFVLEGHNGKENVLHLPFQYYDMTFEETNDELHSKYVSDAYQDMLTSHYQFPQYVTTHKYFVGTVDDMGQIDRKITEKIKQDNGKYLAIVPLEYQGDVFGSIGIVYDNSNPVEIPNDEILIKELFRASEIISPQLKLVIQHKDKYERYY